MALKKLEQLSNLYDGYRRSFRFDQHSLLLIQDEGQRYLIENVCPHRGLPFDRAAVRAGCIACPFHGLQFDLNTGAGINTDDARIKVYPIVYEGNQLTVDL